MTPVRALVPCAVAVLLTGCSTEASSVQVLDGKRMTDEQIASYAGPSTATGSR